MKHANALTDLLGLRNEPVAIAFRETAPQGMRRIDAVAPSGCTYWKLAAEGASFYTEASDHFGCPVGSYTHGVELPPDKAEELNGLIGTMVELKYLDPAEVPGIPRRQEKFGVALYGPLGRAAFEPDVVMVCGNAKQMMLLGEAAHAAGIGGDATTAGRPTCAVIPRVMQAGQATANLGCIGNRVYTGLADDEMYFAFAGSELSRIVEKLETIVHANRELEKFHRARVT